MNSPASGAGSLLSPEEVTDTAKKIRRLTDVLNQVLLGQEAVIEAATVCLLSRGHLLLEGLPGLGKTELVKGLARSLRLDFKRIQFTPDLLPGDITGSHILEEKGGTRSFVFRRGPIFGHLILADEINRASPKTQAALLEAMQERRVTLLGQTHELPTPFFVLATQNPIELEGTYPLPEAQLDRFLFKVDVPSVGAETLAAILATRLRGEPPQLEPVLEAAGLNELFAAVDRVFLPKAVTEWIARLIAATDPRSAAAPTLIKDYVRFGASPRAAIGLANSGRAMALLRGKPNVGFDEVKRVLPHVLRHRLILSYQAGLDGRSVDSIIEELLNVVPELSPGTSSRVEG